MDYKEQIEALNNLEAIAYGYNINGEVLGMACSDFEQIMVDAADSITGLLSRAEAAETRAEMAERESKEAINYMRRIFGWCTGCVHFTGNYGMSCKVGKMCDCSGEDDSYKFCGEEE